MARRKVMKSGKRRPQRNHELTPKDDAAEEYKEEQKDNDKVHPEVSEEMPDLQIKMAIGTFSLEEAITEMVSNLKKSNSFHHFYRENSAKVVGLCESINSYEEEQTTPYPDYLDVLCNRIIKECPNQTFMTVSKLKKFFRKSFRTSEYKQRLVQDRVHAYEDAGEIPDIEIKMAAGTFSIEEAITELASNLRASTSYNDFCLGNSAKVVGLSDSIKSYERTLHNSPDDYYLDFLCYRIIKECPVQSTFMTINKLKRFFQIAPNHIPHRDRSGRPGVPY